jgi:DNA replication protein DnaC
MAIKRSTIQTAGFDQSTLHGLPSANSEFALRPSSVAEPIPTQLRSLRLSGMLETLDARNRQAVGGQWSYIEFLSRLLEDEVARRGQKQLTSRLRRATLNSGKTLEDFNFNFNPQLNRQQVLALAAGDYLREARNVLICGPSGVGKTHLAQALGQEACRQGYDVLFVATHKMLQHLAAGRADNSVERRLAVYLRPDLLILDDFGLRPLPPPGPEDLYDVISERYEKGSILLTSNRAPQEWPTLFGDPLLASAGLDRLGDRAEMLVIRGQSYRTVTAQARNASYPNASYPSVPVAQTDNDAKALMDDLDEACSEDGVMRFSSQTP